MILVDFSSIIHRMVFSAAKEVNPSEKDGKYVTSEYANLVLYNIMQELINVQLKYQADYGELVLLFDDWRRDYWRKDVYPDYKAGRSSAKAKTKINYTEVFEHVNTLVQQLETNTPWRCVTVDRAEADDTMLVLAREFNPREKICIYSPDKDMIQAQRWTENVQQYSALTKKWLVPEGKHDSMEHWTLEHVILGDDSDGVPKIVAHCEFSDNFKEHLENNDVIHTSPFEFRNAVKCKDTDTENHEKALVSYDIQKTNRKGEDIGLDVYKSTRFGPAALTKALDEHGSLDAFLDSHPLYREHYERNFTLVMEEGIPKEIWDSTMTEYKEANMDYNKDEFVEYLQERNLFDIEMSLIKVFKCQDTLTIDNCGW